MNRLPLSALEMRAASAALGTIFPPAPDLGFPIGIADMDLERFLHETRCHVPFFAAFGIRFAIWFVALAPIFVLRRLALVHQIEERDRARVLGDLAASNVYFVRQMVMVLKATGALLYGGHPAIRTRCHAGAPPAESGAVPPASASTPDVPWTALALASKGKRAA